MANSEVVIQTANICGEYLCTSNNDVQSRTTSNIGHLKEENGGKVGIYVLRQVKIGKQTNNVAFDSTISCLMMHVGKCGDPDPGEMDRSKRTQIKT